MSQQSDLALDDLVGRNVVIDTKGTMVFIGRLVRAASDCVVLAEVDAHDCEQGYSSKEMYMINARISGPRPSREKLYVPWPNVLAISALDDIIVD